jgi:hypothetical protein
MPILGDLERTPTAGNDTQLLGSPYFFASIEVLFSVPESFEALFRRWVLALLEQIVAMSILR